MREQTFLQGERPRERLLAHGAAALSDAELVSLLLRTGIAGASALDVARDLIERFGGVAGLLAAPALEVAAVRGVGRAKCAEIAAVVELARRSLSEEAGARDALASPQAVRDYLRLVLAGRPHEVFVGLFLDSQNRLLASEELFRGTLAQNQRVPPRGRQGGARAKRSGRDLSGKDTALPPCPPLRTGHDGFLSSGSSRSKRGGSAAPACTAEHQDGVGRVRREAARSSKY